MSKQTVLVAVINRRKDLDILLSKRWYRIPVSKAPSRRFDWLAFYQTSALGKDGKLIRYYARINSCIRVMRKDLLPEEKGHLRYREKYYKFAFSDISELKRPIYNSTGMRFTLGFTTLPRLLRFKYLHTLFSVRPLEMIFRKILKKEKIPFLAEYPIIMKGRVIYRLDLAVFCRLGKINIECDMPKYHSGRRHDYDRHRNQFLRRRGWEVVRFTDEDILLHSVQCLKVLCETICKLGGVLIEN